MHTLLLFYIVLLFGVRISDAACCLSDALMVGIESVEGGSLLSAGLVHVTRCQPIFIFLLLWQLRLHCLIWNYCSLKNDYLWYVTRMFKFCYYFFYSPSRWLHFSRVVTLRSIYGFRDSLWRYVLMLYRPLKFNPMQSLSKDSFPVRSVRN